MKKIYVLLFLILFSRVSWAQYPPITLYDVAGNPYPSGGGASLGGGAPGVTCYTRLNGATVPCIFSGGGGIGTVTSVGLVGSGALFSATPGTPVTTSGTLNVDSQLQAQSANCVVSGPSSGASAPPTCRALIPADIPVSVPPWLQFLGDGSESAPVCTSGCNATGEHWYASLNVPVGQVMYNSGGGPLVIRSTGTCTIAGTVSVSVNSGSFAGNTTTANWSGSGGGGGFGAANGTAGASSAPLAGGSAGTSGVSGGIGNAETAATQKFVASGNPFSGFVSQLSSTFFAVYGGAAGGAGGSSGGAGGKGAGTVIIACAVINFTGTIDATGGNGVAGGANTGGGGGGGGGIVIMRSPSFTNSGTISTTGGSPGAIGTGTSTAGGTGGAGWSRVFTQ
jgi:hypothetical protein